MANWVLRDLFGIIVVLLPGRAALLARLCCATSISRWASPRMVLMNLFPLMAALPIKMMLRWAIN